MKTLDSFKAHKIIPKYVYRISAALNLWILLT